MLSGKEILIKNLLDLEKLAKKISPYLKANFFLLLQGELGVGKTTFTKIIAKNIGIKSQITSPTFSVLQQYKIEDDYYLNHFDFFRLSNQEDLSFFQELTNNNLNIIEWPENNFQFWQNKKYIHLIFQYDKLPKNKKRRLIKIKNMID